MKVDIVGVLIDNLTKDKVLERILQNARSNETKYVVTPYSELIVFAQNDPEYKNVLNRALLALPDGIGIIWAAKFLSLKGNWLISIWQVVYTGASIIFNPNYIRTVIKEQVSGNRLIYDLAKLASDNNLSLAMVGSEENVARVAASNLKQLYPNLQINLATQGSRPFNDQTIQEIASSNSDILLIAYSPPKQEKWIADNLNKFNVKLAIGLGGTFDYIARKRLMAPKFLHYMGLEWLWRLITQPWRIKRIWNAVPVFIWKVYKYKLKNPSVR